jgi:spore germination cell wall hydrolase CwlJ-like protein
LLILMPTGIGFQDIASLISRQPHGAERRQAIASPFGTIHAATFSMARPLGSDIPQIAGYTLASLDPREAGSQDVPRILGLLGVEPKRVFPVVNRTNKGDRLVPVQPAEAAPPSVPDMPPQSAEAKSAAPDEDIQTNLIPPDAGKELAPHSALPQRSEPEAASAAVDDAKPTAADNMPEPEEALSESGTPEFSDDNPATVTARVFFGAEPLGGQAARIEPWAPGATPIVEPAYVNDPDLKRILHPDQAAVAALPGETIAGKGEVTGVGKHPKSPAERLGLMGATRAKAEKCLTDAIYFEARGEVVNGQIAVAQVVLNRVFSGFYPSTVCGVVYQNAHRRLACQFTFACDGIPDRVTEPEAWARAKTIARDTLDGKLWLSQVGKSTHYHAYWVRPNWVREMMKLHKLGVHTFYRPRAWGDGADAPVWGDAVATAEAAKKL